MSVNSFRLSATWRRPSLVLTIGHCTLSRSRPGSAGGTPSLDRVAEQTQFDVAPAAHSSATRCMSASLLGLFDVEAVAGFMQADARIEAERRVGIDVADPFLVRHGIAAHVRAGAVRHHRGPGSRSKFNLTFSGNADTTKVR